MMLPSMKTLWLKTTQGKEVLVDGVMVEFQIRLGSLLKILVMRWH